MDDRKQQGGKEGEPSGPFHGREMKKLYSFFNPHGEINITRNHLPHWHQGETWVFVTWRLKDSLPKSILDQCKEEMFIWLKLHPVSCTSITERLLGVFPKFYIA